MSLSSVGGSVQLQLHWWPESFHPAAVAVCQRAVTLVSYGSMSAKGAEVSAASHELDHLVVTDLSLYLLLYVYIPDL